MFICALVNLAFSNLIIQLIYGKYTTYIKIYHTCAIGSTSRLLLAYLQSNLYALSRQSGSIIDELKYDAASVELVILYDVILCCVKIVCVRLKVVVRVNYRNCILII